ncbi:hypothetical protein [Paenibacillus sp. YN15]|uniref:hypothetical protein n=1 Tax=Paenibacillus sp. YN15 TaxID=1742774 RepID=UPI000DCAFCC4|nr:hypothetical protein [Paenibacillus sp. YN15]RAV06613.1 hypothetical protein DQG13_01945 [Paenibacillus sp. YN15]
MNHKFISITQPKFKDALRNVITEDESLAVVLHLNDTDYVLKDQTLYHQGVPLSLDDIFRLIIDTEKNEPLPEQLLMAAIFTFLYSKRDLRNGTKFETSVNELSAFLGTSVGSKGFRLVEKLKSFKSVYGVIPSEGVFTVLEVEQSHGKLILRSPYFHRILNLILSEKPKLL